MANARTIVSEIADEAADLLGVSNMDRRIFDWIGLTFNDMVSRSINPVFHDVMGPLTVADDSNGVDLSADQEAYLGSPILLVMTRSGGNTIVPEYREPVDFDRLYKSRGTGGSVATATEPRYWTVSTSSLDGTEYDGRRSVRYWPQVTEAYSAWLWHTGNAMDDTPAGTDYVWLPYHFEHVLVWGTCAKGAPMVRPELADAYKAEYELWLQAMTLLMNRAPDQNTTLKGIRPGELDMPFLQVPRLPGTIS
jgi:hypothetical protein